MHLESIGVFENGFVVLQFKGRKCWRAFPGNSDVVVIQSA
jgi:hypothetical protein